MPPVRVKGSAGKAMAQKLVAGTAAIVLYINMGSSGEMKCPFGFLIKKFQINNYTNKSEPDSKQNLTIDSIAAPLKSMSSSEIVTDSNPVDDVSSEHPDLIPDIPAADIVNDTDGDATNLDPSDPDSIDLEKIAAETDAEDAENLGAVVTPIVSNAGVSRSSGVMSDNALSKEEPNQSESESLGVDKVTVTESAEDPTASTRFLINKIAESNAQYQINPDLTGLESKPDSSDSTNANDIDNTLILDGKNAVQEPKQLTGISSQDVFPLLDKETASQKAENSGRFWSVDDVIAQRDRGSEPSLEVTDYPKPNSLGSGNSDVPGSAQSETSPDDDSNSANSIGSSSSFVDSFAQQVVRITASSVQKATAKFVDSIINEELQKDWPEEANESEAQPTGSEAGSVGRSGSNTKPLESGSSSNVGSEKESPGSQSETNAGSGIRLNESGSGSGSAGSGLKAGSGSGSGTTTSGSGSVEPTASPENDPVGMMKSLTASTKEEAGKVHISEYLPK